MRVGTIHFTASLAALIIMASAQSNRSLIQDFSAPPNAKSVQAVHSPSRTPQIIPSLSTDATSALGELQFLDDDVCTPPTGCGVAEPVTPSYLMNTNVDFCVT